MADQELCKELGNAANSVVVIVWHLARNLKSRFTNFQTSDGEEAWRNREEELAERTVSRHELLEKWEDGWNVLRAALSELSDDDLSAAVTIRNR